MELSLKTLCEMSVSEGCDCEGDCCDCCDDGCCDCCDDDCC